MLCFQPDFSPSRILLFTVMGLQFVMSPIRAMMVAEAAPPEVFPVRAIRRPSDVAVSPSLMPGAAQPRWSTLSISETLIWVDAKSYRSWNEKELESGHPGQKDPMFADVYYNLSAVGLAKPVQYVSGEQQVGTVYWVDSRVGLVVTPAGSPILVLEKELSEEQGLAFETALSALGFEVGKVDGKIDAGTRKAVNAYFKKKGHAYAFANPVITDALLKEVLTPTTP